MIDGFIGTNGFLSNGYILQAVPALIGAFAGAPVLARELGAATMFTLRDWAPSRDCAGASAAGLRGRRLWRIALPGAGKRQ